MKSEHQPHATRVLKNEKPAETAFSAQDKRGTGSDLLFVTEVFVLSDVKPVRVCEPWCSADCAPPRSRKRQAPHK
jgi:hypothetical protein